MRVLNSNHRWLNAVAYNWNGSYLYAGSTDSGSWNEWGLDRWEFGESGVTEVIAGGLNQVTHIWPLADGRLLVAGHNADFDAARRSDEVRVVDARNAPGSWILSNSISAKTLAVSPCGKRVLVTNPAWKRRESIRAYRLPLVYGQEAEWAVRLRLPNGAEDVEWNAILFGPTDERILTVEKAWYQRFSACTIRWRSATTGKPLGKSIPMGRTGLYRPQFVGASGHLVDFHQSTIRIHGGIDFDELATNSLPRPFDHFTGLVVHPDGTRVFASCNDGTVREYDAATLQELRVYDWKVGKLTCVAVAPDGLTAAVGSDTGKVVVWDLE